jgi:hypothetical protein
MAKDTQSRITSALGDLRRFVPGALVALVVAYAAVWVIPTRSRNPLAETTVWALLVLVSFAGWGSLVRLVIARNERVDFGLRAAWGAGLLCFMGGMLMVPALMVHTSALVLVEVGLVLAIASLVRESKAVGAKLRYIARFTRRDPGLAVVGLVVGSIVAVHCLGAIADWHTNPYDDDIAYLAFVKKLSDTGTLIEPFSFRRLSAYGGQTFFLELVSVRAAPSQAHTFDRCICFLMIVLLIMGHRTRGRRPTYLVVISTISMLATMQSIAINTASYYSGVVFFLALFRTLVWVSERDLSSWRNAAPIALVAVAACTLRQNYLPVPALILAVSYAVRLRRAKGARLASLGEPLWAAGLSLMLLAPWFVVSWQSNRTYLYPLMAGTFNPALQLNASGWNFAREVAFQAGVAVDGLPLRTLALFILAVAFIKERSPRVPLGALCVGALGGFVAVVHSFTQSDTQNIGRYAFAFLIALVLAAALTTGSARPSTPALRGRVEIAAGIVLFAIFTQLVMSRELLWKDYAVKFHNIEALRYTANRGPETALPELMMTERLQGAIPSGERMAVMLDEPHYLNFSRNPIWNLDMPGYASLPPGMPSFRGSEALEEYFRALGLRWIVFVQPEFSRYHYRREYFLELFVHEQEIWRTYAPYLVDFIDSLVAIQKRHREVYAERGIVVVDLAEPPRGKDER